MYQDLKCINIFNEILIMTIGELIFNLPPDLETLIRSIEKPNRKDINTQLSLVFNKKVKSSMARSLPVENLLPQKVGSIINYFQ